MSIKTLINTIENSSEFKEFKKKHKKTVLYSAFLLIRQAFGNLIVETQQLDYWLGGEEVAEFFIDEKANVQFKVDKLEPSKEKNRVFTELDKKILEVEELDKLIIKEIEKNSSEVKDVSKIICVLQKIENKQVWNITCIIGLSMLRFHLDMNGKVLESKKGSLFDVVSIEPGKGKKKGNKKNV